MPYPGSCLPVLIGGLFLAACSDGTGPGQPPSLDCSDATTQTLAIGQHLILDPAQTGACVRIPAAGADGAEHLYLPVGTGGEVTKTGVSAGYAISGTLPVVAAVAPLRSPLLSAFQRPLPAGDFHSLLRERERALSQSPEVALFDRGRIAQTTAPPPVVGDQRTFNVCASTTCKSFVQTTATAEVVGSRVALFVDDAAPAGGYTNADLVYVANLFDDHLYPIDTTAFGRESDIDDNGVVIVLLTHRVNALSPNCNATRSVVLGYFFGADLLRRSRANRGSNEAEIFYGLVPDPDNSECDISAAFALSHLPATFIHEFQHMISFNHHRLVRGGGAEDIWLNEGLSHFAEELGGRRVPDAECPSGDCLEEFAAGNLTNALAYLDPDSLEIAYLVMPDEGNVALTERGAAWLFVRWLVDHFAADSVLGTDLTRRMVETSLVGSTNVVAQTGVSFSILVPEWQLTNYLDDLPGFDQPSARLRYKTWNFREVAAAKSLPYPLRPDSTDGAGYSHIGVLRSGSGRHVRVVQSPGAGEVDLRIIGRKLGPKGNLLTGPLPRAIDPRVALVRIH